MSRFWRRTGSTKEFVRCDKCLNIDRSKPDVETVLSVLPTSSSKYTEVLQHFWNGLVLGNKLCCIIYFCKFIFLGMKPAVVSDACRKSPSEFEDNWGKVGFMHINSEELEHIKKKNPYWEGYNL